MTDGTGRFLWNPAQEPEPSVPPRAPAQEGRALLFVLTCVCLLAAQAAFNKCHSRVRHFGGVFAIAVVFMACVCVLRVRARAAV